MIKDNKKLNPFVGIVIGIALIFIPMFGMISTPIFDNLSTDLFILVILPFIFTGTFFLGLNASYLGIRILAHKMDESAMMMNPKTFLHSTCIVTKVIKSSDLYIIKFSDNYLHVIRMNDKTNVSASWYRRVFGPKLPTSFPLKCPVVTEFNEYKIRRCLGKAILYDIDEEQWISGQATMFSIFFFSKSMVPLLYPDVFQNFVDLIDQSN